LQTINESLEAVPCQKKLRARQMRDVVIIGGGLSGLVAASELEKAGVDYTLIEVKRQLGGSLGSLQIGESILDRGAFAFEDKFDVDWLASLGLEDAFFKLGAGVVAFKRGAGALIDALSSKITAPRLMRMAVSSIGEEENGRYSICMENGLVFDAKRLILALPARYAERLFYGYISPVTEALLDYHYDTVQRISVVCKSSELPENLFNPPDMAYVFIHRSEHECRVPAGYTLLQFGLRINPARLQSPEQSLDFLVNEFALPEPIASHLGYWPEADPISCFDDGFGERLAAIRALLPEGIALIGSDYSPKAPGYQGVTRLEERIQEARLAGQRFAS
jgi:protoporphyrinogen oxidase